VTASSTPQGSSSAERQSPPQDEGGPSASEVQPSSKAKTRKRSRAKTKKSKTSSSAGSSPRGEQRPSASPSRHTQPAAPTPQSH
jgi:hypothetical protein